MNDDAISAALEVATLFEELQVPYMIGGSMASTIWGEPRFTQDVDFVAALETQHVDALIAELGDDWYADRESIEVAISARGSFNIIRLKRMVKIDVFVPPNSGHHANKWSRVRREAIDPESSQRVAVTSPEDILLQKLEWYRSGGEVSEQQWRDVTALLRVMRADLDDSYLEEWARKMELDELLARARAASQV